MASLLGNLRLELFYNNTIGQLVRVRSAQSSSGYFDMSTATAVQLEANPVEGDPITPIQCYNSPPADWANGLVLIPFTPVLTGVLGSWNFTLTAVMPSGPLTVAWGVIEVQDRSIPGGY